MEGLKRSILFICAIIGTVLSERDLTQEPGHMNPFGSGRPTHAVRQIEGFPDQKEFIRDHVIGSMPLKMKGAATLSPAFTLWTDEYFLSAAIPDDTIVHLETRKKEDRDQITEEMRFKQFLKVYNNTEHYMVDDVPDPLRKDLVFPCALQCPFLMETSIVAALMWFSSGGTNSVVHADGVDNINCLYRGEKTFVMVDPKEFGNKVDLDHPEGLYSSIDVDKMNYTRFPGLADIEYYSVSVKAGDCLYIPYRWIHQVRSYESNLAVNVWWDHHTAKQINIDSCNSGCNTNIRLSTIETHGLDSITLSIGSIKDQLKGNVAVRSLDIDGFRRSLMGEKIFEQFEEEEISCPLYCSLRQNMYYYKKGFDIKSVLFGNPHTTPNVNKELLISVHSFINLTVRFDSKQ